MDLTLEETMQRIDKLERNDVLHRQLCRTKKYPYRISFYKGEGQILVVPSVTGIGWCYVEMAWYRKISDVQNAYVLGETLLEALEQIRISPVDARTEEERKNDSIINATSCKTYKEFNKSYLRCGAIYYEDGTFVISQTRRLKGNKGYGGDDSNLIYLPSTTTTDELGNALIKSFAEMEQFYNKEPKKKEAPRVSFETLSGNQFSFTAPSEDVYTDEQDYHAAEIYQGYSCCKEGKDESVADMYFSCASDLNCNAAPEHIQSVYERYAGQSQNFVCEKAEHPVFEQRIEIETEAIHRIVYVKRISESELLSCELVLKKKEAGKRLCNKIIKDFEAMVKSCREEKE